MTNWQAPNRNTISPMIIVQDAMGNIWWISTHRRALSDDEMETAARAFEDKA